MYTKQRPQFKIGLLWGLVNGEKFDITKITEALIDLCKRVLQRNSKNNRYNLFDIDEERT